MSEEPGPTVFIVDDDDSFRDSLEMLCTSVGLQVEGFASASEFLEQARLEREGCLVLDIRMPGMSGLELQRELGVRGAHWPILFITGHGDVPMAVTALKAGAYDFLTKPFPHQELLDRIHAALRQDAAGRSLEERVEQLAERYEKLTPREREVMELVVAGQANKVVASRLGISQRTVEIHRAQVMEKMAAESLAHLVRMAVALEQQQDA
ncbi:MAG TPA: response regulator transcription factor [Thermoanaerobaculia bacterium]|nr:response regulator transcription factor [Thermoanaerobaculia bacterium]